MTDQKPYTGHGDLRSFLASLPDPDAPDVVDTVISSMGDEVRKMAELLARAQERLTQIAVRIHPCPVPDVYAGYDQCSHGTWPCQQTEAAWLARGLDRDTQVRAELDAIRPDTLEGDPC